MKTIKQSVIFSATPHEVFEMLMDSRKHSAFTGATAVISRKVGGKISAYDGYIEGKNLKIITDKKIVQKWRGSDWDEGVLSTVTFALKPSGKGCALSFTQEGVPDSEFKAISDGWKEHYWDKMKNAIKKS